MVKFCKLDLKLESVSIVSNGSLIQKTWFEDYAQYLDILAISCDSFDHDTNVKIGRSSKKGDRAHTQQYILEQIGGWCEEYNVRTLFSHYFSLLSAGEVQNQQRHQQAKLGGGHERHHPDTQALSLEVLPSTRD